MRTAVGHFASTPTLSFQRTCPWSYLGRVLPVHGVDGRSRRHARVHVHQLRVGRVPRGSLLHPAAGVVGHVRRARMVRARRATPACNFSGRVGHEVGVEEAVGLLRGCRRVLRPAPIKPFFPASLNKLECLSIEEWGSLGWPYVLL